MAETSEEASSYATDNDHGTDVTDNVHGTFPYPKAECAIRYVRNVSVILALVSIVFGAGLTAWFQSGLGYVPFLALLSSWTPLGIGMPALTVALASDMFLLPTLRGEAGSERIGTSVIIFAAACVFFSTIGIHVSLPAIEDTLTSETTDMLVTDEGKSLRLLDDPAEYATLRTQDDKTLMVPASLLENIPVGTDGNDTVPTLDIKVYKRTLIPVSARAVD